jgi:O-antigen/teichoic acid export membrane protein
MADVLVRWHNLMLLPVLLVLAVGGPAFIRWYYKPEFHQAARYLPALLVMLAGNSTVRIISHVLMGLGHPSAYAKMVGVVVVVAVPGMVWSTLTGGSPATVLWWLIAGWLAGGVIALWLVVKHRAGIRWLQTYLQPIGLAVAAALPILIAQRLAPSALWLVVPLAVAVYAFGAYRLARMRAQQGHADLSQLEVPVADAYATGR